MNKVHWIGIESKNRYFLLLILRIPLIKSKEAWTNKGTINK